MVAPCKQSSNHRCFARASIWPLVLVAAISVPGQAGAAEPKLRVFLGFDGYYRVGYWTPLRVELTAGKEPLAGYVFAEVSDPDHTLGRVVARKPIRLAPGQKAVVPLLVRPGRTVPVVRVGLLARAEDARPLWMQEVPSGVSLEEARQGRGVARALPTRDVLVVVVGRLELGSLERSLPKDAPLRIVVASLGDSRPLPRHWLGYEGVDYLVLALGQKGLLRQFSQEQVRAIRRWLRRQGHVLAVLGPGAEDAYTEEHPLRKLVLGSWKHWEGLRRSNALEEFADTSVPVALGPAFGPRRVSVALLEPGTSQVLLQQGTVPILLRESRGFGLLSCLTVDMQAEPLLKWRGRGKFWQRVLMLHLLVGNDTGGTARTTRFSHIGVTDLSGQLRGALDQFDEAPVVSFMLVSLLILGYLVLAGPIPFLVFRRWPQYSPWSWAALGALLVGAAFLAHVLAARWKPPRMLANQVDLLDVDLKTKQLRTTSFATLYSPRMASLPVHLALQTPPLAVPAVQQGYLAWLGHPGNALGGMASAAPATSRNYVYLLDPARLQVDHMPLWQWSTRSFLARGFAPLELSPLEIRMEAYQDEFPRGYLVNRSPWVWHDAWLAYQRWVIRLGRVEPGQRIELQLGLSRRELQNELTGREMYYDPKTQKMRSRLRAYDPKSFDVRAIVRQMFFHQAGGGRRYTQLWHRYQGFVDWSEYLELKQGVLVARISSPLSRLVVGGQPLEQSAVRCESWLRVKFPLLERPSATTAQVP